MIARNKDNTVGINRKCIPPYKGPFIVRKCFPHDRYLITDLDNYQQAQTPYSGIIEARHLKPWLHITDSNPTDISDLDPDPPDIPDSDPNPVDDMSDSGKSDDE